jgi:membrane peptidoglycan carboxypeptidase
MLFAGNSAEGRRGWFYLQVARQLYTGGQSGPLAGIDQTLVALKLDLRYSPAMILGLYANIADFGHGFVGLAAASCGYFARSPAALSWGQAAMLAAVAHAPVTGDPFMHLTRARAGEHAVLGMLLAAGQLTSRQASRAYRRPVHLSRAQPDRNDPSQCLTHH